MLSGYHRWFLFLLLLLTACSSTLSGSSTSASSRITVYSSLPSDSIEDFLAVFRREHPTIEVDLVFDTAQQLTDDIIASGEAPVADVIWGLPVANALQLEWLDRLKPYTPANLHRIDPRFRDPANPPHWVGTAARVLVFCVNRERMAELNLPIPNSWQALSDPMYQGQITFPFPPTAGSGYLVLATAFQQFGNADGWQYLETLDSSVERYSEDARVACEIPARGDIPIGISFDYRAVQRVEAGDPIEIVYPTDGAGWDVEVNALVRKPIINPSAHIFLDWAISETAVNEYAKVREVLTINYDDTATANPISTDALLDEDIPWIAANRERIMREWTALYADKAQVIPLSDIE